MTVTYSSLLREASDTLKSVGIADADTDARLFMEEIFNINRAFILGHAMDEIGPDNEEKVSRFRVCVSQRSQRIPLQHILGHQEFMGLEFQVNDSVLIPRQDTEILVEEALKEVHDGMNILDMCTGSGCILLSLLYYSNNCKGTGADISDKALMVAKANSLRVLSDKGNLEVSFVNSNLFEGLDADNKYDMIVSNPPYIRTCEIEKLEAEVRDHDPLIALDGGEDGLYFYREIIKNAVKFLKKGGLLFFEIGFDQKEEVSGLFSEYGYIDIKSYKDYAGLDRVVCARIGC